MSECSIKENYNSRIALEHFVVVENLPTKFLYVALDLCGLFCGQVGFKRDLQTTNTFISTGRV